MARVWLLCVVAAAVCTAVHGDVPPSSRDPNGLDLSLAVLAAVRPGLTALAGDASDTEATVAAAVEELWRTDAMPSFDEVAAALIATKPDLSFLQVGAYGLQPDGSAHEQDLVARIVADGADSAAGLVLDPLAEAVDAVKAQFANRITPHGTPHGITTNQVAICSHNSMGSMYGKRHSDVHFEFNYLPWRRDPDADVLSVHCRTLPAVRGEHAIKYLDLLQVGCDGYEMEPLTGLGPLRPHLIWYDYAKMTVPHMDFIGRMLENKGYLVRYDDQGFAWAWWVNPLKVPSSTRPLPSVELVPGVARVEGPVPRASSSLLAPVLANSASAGPYVMQGKWHRNYCYYIVFDAVRRLERLRVTFAKDFAEAAGMMEAEWASDPMDPPFAPTRQRIYPVKASSANKAVKWHSLGAWEQVQDEDTSAVTWQVNTSDDTAQPATRVRLRSVMPLKFDGGSLAIHTVQVSFRDDDGAPSHGEL